MVLFFSKVLISKRTKYKKISIESIFRELDFLENQGIIHTIADYLHDCRLFAQWQIICAIADFSILYYSYVEICKISGEF
jgi:hypothetical protein